MLTTQDLPALKERFRQLIHELGLVGLREDEDGDFMFRYERRTMLLIFDASDPTFLWLRLPNFHCYPAGDDAMEARVAEALNMVNGRCKLVKLTRTRAPDDEGNLIVSSAVSFLVCDLEAISPEQLERFLAAAKLGAVEFMDFVREEPEETQIARATQAAVADEVRH